MYTKDGWLSWDSFKVLCFIILFVTVIGALSSCNTPEPIYYLYVTDYDEESCCVEIREYVDNKEIIVCVLDRYLDSRPDSKQIKEAMDTQIGFHSSYAASIAYWEMVDE